MAKSLFEKLGGKFEKQGDYLIVNKEIIYT